MKGILAAALRVSAGLWVAFALTGAMTGLSVILVTLRITGSADLAAHRPIPQGEELVKDKQSTCVAPKSEAAAFQAETLVAVIMPNVCLATAGSSGTRT